MNFYVVRKLDKLGRLVLPLDYRKALGLENGSDIVLAFEEGGIIIKPYNDNSRKEPIEKRGHE